MRCMPDLPRLNLTPRKCSDRWAQGRIHCCHIEQVEASRAFIGKSSLYRVLPTSTTRDHAMSQSTSAYLDAIAAHARTTLAPLANAIDQDGMYPDAYLAELGRLGGFGA